MADNQPAGITETERLLANLCQRSFLRLWSYANPYKDDGHEFCDVLAVFDDHVFIFFDREKQLPDLTTEGDWQVQWDRWKRNAIDRQINTVQGAERYLRSGRKLYLNAKKTKEFPIPMNLADLVVHKIVVAHGAAEACKKFSDSNVYGSLAISYSSPSFSTEQPFKFPFIIHLDKTDPVHVFDTHTLPIILGELDTVKDFSDYLDAKVDAIITYNVLSYCGEEDLLAHYLQNFDSGKGRHRIGNQISGVDALFIGEGEWRDFIALSLYGETKRANKKSYVWDELIQRTCDHWLNGRLLGDGRFLSERGAIYEMAKEPRFMRRALAQNIGDAIAGFSGSRDEITRHLRFFSSFYPDKAYIFLQLWVPSHVRRDEGEETFRARRQHVLRIACGAAKNRYPHLNTIIGIAVEPPKFAPQTGEDFLCLDCSEWSEDLQSEYKRLNANFKFFETATPRRERVTRFVSETRLASRKPDPVRNKVGRNELCPCGSGKKFKKCHGP